MYKIANEYYTSCLQLNLRISQNILMRKVAPVLIKTEKSSIVE